MPRHYVDNKQLYAVMQDYIAAVREAEKTNEPKPRVPDHVGTCLLQIATRLATKPNFASYTYKDEMISDGIENCLMYIDNFNPDKSKNPFAYFTQIIYFAFIRRIQKEKKHVYIKYKSMEKSMVFGESYTGDDVITTTQVGEDVRGEFIRNYEDSLKEKREKTKRKKADE